ERFNLPSPGGCVPDEAPLGEVLPLSPHPLLRLLRLAHAVEERGPVRLLAPGVRHLLGVVRARKRLGRRRPLLRDPLLLRCLTYNQMLPGVQQQYAQAAQQQGVPQQGPPAAQPFSRTYHAEEVADARRQEANWAPFLDGVRQAQEAQERMRRQREDLA
ncbi:MAG: hypothetical protein AAFR65_16650, partial [Pseudomonadota bacterium]